MKAYQCIYACLLYKSHTYLENRLCSKIHQATMVVAICRARKRAIGSECSPNADVRLVVNTSRAGFAQILTHTSERAQTMADPVEPLLDGANF